MNFKFSILIAFLCLNFIFVDGQDLNKENTFNLNFSLMYGDNILNKDELYYTNLNQDVKISNFRFYVSKFKIVYDDNTTFVEENVYHLISLDSSVNENSIIIQNTKNTNIKQVSFYIGVDEEKSLSGEMEGDLDPMNGMFWSWQTGFSSFKIEGISTFSKERKNEFLFHIGGYLDPYNSLREVVFINTQDFSEVLNVKVDLKYVLDKIDLTEQGNIMSPSLGAMKLADFFQKSFRL